MTATAPATKPKAPRTIVKTVVTATGVHTTLAKFATDQLDATRKLCSSIAHVDKYSDLSNKAHDALRDLLKAAATDQP